MQKYTDFSSKQLVSFDIYGHMDHMVSIGRFSLVPDVHRRAKSKGGNCFLESKQLLPFVFAYQHRTSLGVGACDHQSVPEIPIKRITPCERSPPLTARRF